MCRVATISPHLAVFSRFEGGFGQKKADLGPKLQILKMKVQHLRRPFLAAGVEFLAHTLCGCPSHS